VVKKKTKTKAKPKTVKPKKKPCPVCAGGKQVTSASGSNFDMGMPRPCDYCDATGEALERPLYSYLPAQEVRLWEMRDDPANRVRLIARARVGNSSLPLHATELLWLREGLSRDNQIPFLSTPEWDALARLLLDAMSEQTVLTNWLNWERRSGG